MFCVQFIFDAGGLTEEFFEIDGLIDQAANANDGFIGKDNWVAKGGSRFNSIYYWQNEASLKAFSQHPKHLEAKRRYQEWYNGFHVVISEIIKTYGDGAFDHVTGNDRPQRLRKT